MARQLKLMVDEVDSVRWLAARGRQLKHEQVEAEELVYVVLRFVIFLVTDCHRQGHRHMW